MNRRVTVVAAIAGLLAGIPTAALADQRPASSTLNYQKFKLASYFGRGDSGRGFSGNNGGRDHDYRPSDNNYGRHDGNNGHYYGGGNGHYNGGGNGHYNGGGDNGHHNGWGDSDHHYGGGDNGHHDGGGTKSHGC
ncbi:hypothetical protein EDF56_101710 [Novosphingobium sp. PhB165]|uniref:hypothetical protein n=1 Tax=Novosphingobium sp. PhB165 TaxID=2485105 RepID=UPI00104412A0|nr:hypothetical protein [Novosphingobium sp. PhB165]TCM22030.1 hypothetical protein EDF56_101710 [Novosphingobium sp. PhB165]